MTTRSGIFLKHVLIVVAVLAGALLVFSRFGGNELVVGNLVLRAQSGAGYPLSAPSSEARVARSGEAGGVPTDGPRPRNVILFIGDGMGIGHVSAASALLEGPGSMLMMADTPFVGLMRTWASNNLITDSAAAATAMATGHKTRKKALGVLADGPEVRNLFEVARSHGLATGVITTAGLVGATPAAFMVHVASRDDYAAILAQMLDSESEILIGGDWARKRKARRNKPYMEMIGRTLELGSSRGYTVVHDAEEMANAAGPLLALFPARPGSRTDYGPPLAVSTRQALKTLSDEGRGFLLVVESEITDESAHDNDIAAVMEGMRELDEAVALALEESAYRNDTLILVTADHETGGLGLDDGRYGRGHVVVRWATSYHTSTWVPVFAFGPGADVFTGIFDNTELAQRISSVLGLETLPQEADSSSD
jgi:alkaline phosphatase